MADQTKMIDQIDALLPQIHCEKCTYKGCYPYAEALAIGQAPNNLCQPGGEKTMHAIAKLLHQEPLPLEADAVKMQTPQTAVIDSTHCIGCTKCIKVCPVDAIIGAAKQLHVIINNDCTGCQLCLPTCPVDCIDLIDNTDLTSTWTIGAPAPRLAQAAHHRALYQNRQTRLKTIEIAKTKTRQAQQQTKDLQADIQAAIQRAKAKKQRLSSDNRPLYE